MYERMLDKQVVPTITEMTEYCGNNAELFTLLNAWLSETYGTSQTVKFPYGNQYGWGIALFAVHFSIGGSSAKDFFSAVLMGLSIGETLVGIFVAVIGFTKQK